MGRLCVCGTNAACGACAALGLAEPLAPRLAFPCLPGMALLVAWTEPFWPPTYEFDLFGNPFGMPLPFRSLPMKPSACPPVGLNCPVPIRRDCTALPLLSLYWPGFADQPLPATLA